MEVTADKKRTRGRPKLSEEERKRRVKERNDFYYGKIKEAMKLAKSSGAISDRAGSIPEGIALSSNEVIPSGAIDVA